MSITVVATFDQRGGREGWTGVMIESISRKNDSARSGPRTVRQASIHSSSSPFELPSHTQKTAPRQSAIEDQPPTFEYAGFQSEIFKVFPWSISLLWKRRLTYGGAAIKTRVVLFSGCLSVRTVLQLLAVAVREMRKWERSWTKGGRCLLELPAFAC